MKKLLIFLSGILAAIALLVVGVFMLTASVAGVANDFFAHIKAEEPDKAWSLLSSEFQSATSQEELLTTLVDMQLEEISDSTWKSKIIKNTGAQLGGTVIDISGKPVPIAVDLIKENGHWRIQYLGIDSASSSTKPGETALNPPTEAEQVALVKESLTVFGESVNGKDFSPFVEHISETWKDSGVTAEQMNQVFSSFIDQEINILPVINKLAPAFDEKVIVANNGVMSITGAYPSTPTKIKFELDYIKEGTSWKTVRTAINVE